MNRRTTARTCKGLLAVGVVAVSAVCLAGVAVEQCGDGVCEGPETAENCPEDCGGSSIGDDAVNPLCAVPSADLIEWRDSLEDGGFERGMDDVVVLPENGVQTAIVRSQEAARSGAWGIQAQSERSAPLTVRILAPIEKGETTRYSFWVRSASGPADLAVRVVGVDGPGQAPYTLYVVPERPTIGEQWAEFAFAYYNTAGLETAYVAIDVPAGACLYIDDAAVEREEWAVADDAALTRIVGGIPVPPSPAAPVHFNVLIHIEDPPQITTVEPYFVGQTTVFRELARVLYQHGGFLTIQPEEDWPMASLRFAPDTLANLAEEYGVVYSTHTHGPNCRDADGRLRSAQDCNSNRDTAGWDATPCADADPWVPEYVAALRELIAEASGGTPVSDHNGNWEYDNVSALAAVGITTWSAYKNHNTQATFDALYVNPWRPTACDANETPDVFCQHDPATEMIYIPGWGQAISRYPQRIQGRLAAMLSQVIQSARSDRVNSFYIVTHVGHYADPCAPTIDVDETTGAVTLHASFREDLARWDTLLTELVDPLVAAGYLAWTSLPEIGKLFFEWEEANGLRSLGGG